MPIGVVGWSGEGGATVAVKGYFNTGNNLIASIGAIFTSTYHTKYITKPMVKLIN